MKKTLKSLNLYANAIRDNYLKSSHGNTGNTASVGNFNMAEKVEGEKKLINLPLARIKTIMRSSPDMSHAGQESIFMVAKATVSESLMCTNITG